MAKCHYSLQERTGLFLEGAASQPPEFYFYVLDLEYVGFNSIALVSPHQAAVAFIILCSWCTNTLKKKFVILSNTFISGIKWEVI